MTTTIQTSAINIQSVNRHSRLSIYSVIVNGEDGDCQKFEIEASSDEEANGKANDIALSSMTDVTYVEVYKIA